MPYAKRRGLTNVSFLQADLLQLERIQAGFDLVVCAGVLHHLEDPRRGLQALLEKLRPGGVIRLGLYSTLGRGAISDARAWAKAQGFSATASGIRAFRAAVFAAGETERMHQQLLNSYDYYSLSACRDLVFHVQERSFTWLEVAELVRACGLSVLQVDTKSPAHQKAYHARFPNEPAARSLEHWHVIERMQPAMFTGLYCFWVCRSAELGAVELGWIQNSQRFS